MPFQGCWTRSPKGERDGVDGYVIACFGDPGLDAARELAAGPVVAIAEEAMRTATFLGRSFSVVTTLGRTTGRAWDLAAHYGVPRVSGNSRPESKKQTGTSGSARRARSSTRAESLPPEKATYPS